MTGLPEPWATCPQCRAPDFHYLWRVDTPGVYATWPDPAAPHWRRECKSCGHVWREDAPREP